jgi:hypothetical protein
VAPAITAASSKKTDYSLPTDLGVFQRVTWKPKSTAWLVSYQQSGKMLDKEFPCTTAEDRAEVFQTAVAFWNANDTSKKERIP